MALPPIVCEDSGCKVVGVAWCRSLPSSVRIQGARWRAVARCHSLPSSVRIQGARVGCCPVHSLPNVKKRLKNAVGGFSFALPTPIRKTGPNAVIGRFYTITACSCLLYPVLSCFVLLQTAIKIVKSCLCLENNYYLCGDKTF